MQQAVIFVRVSKKEQDYQRQVEDLRAVAQSQGVLVAAEISEKSGMDEARRQGVTIGRPVGKTEEKAVFLKKYAAVARQLRAGLSVRNTAKLCGVAINTVRKVKVLLSPLTLRSHELQTTTGSLSVGRRRARYRRCVYLEPTGPGFGQRGPDAG